MNLDTLFILPEPGRQDALEQIARAWSLDEVAWIPRSEGSRAMGRASFSFQIIR